jgi:hypothetical protein
MLLLDCREGIGPNVTHMYSESYVCSAFCCLEHHISLNKLLHPHTYELFRTQILPGPGECQSVPQIDS